MVGPTAPGPASLRRRGYVPTGEAEPFDQPSSGPRHRAGVAVDPRRAILAQQCRTVPRTSARVAADPLGGRPSVLGVVRRVLEGDPGAGDVQEGHGEAVGDDVVQLTGDPVALLGPGVWPTSPAWAAAVASNRRSSCRRSRAAPQGERGAGDPRRPTGAGLENRTSPPEHDERTGPEDPSVRGVRAARTSRRAMQMPNQARCCSPGGDDARCPPAATAAGHQDPGPVSLACRRARSRSRQDMRPGPAPRSGSPDHPEAGPWRARRRRPNRSGTDGLRRPRGEKSRPGRFVRNVATMALVVRGEQAEVTPRNGGRRRQRGQGDAPRRPPTSRQRCRCRATARVPHWSRASAGATPAM